MPTKTAEYYTTSPCKDADPWWFRDDGFCFEFSKPENIELSDDELFGDIRDPLSEFWTAINIVEGEKADVTGESEKVLRVEKWNPKII